MGAIVLAMRLAPESFSARTEYTSVPTSAAGAATVQTPIYGSAPQLKWTASKLIDPVESNNRYPFRAWTVFTPSPKARAPEKTNRPSSLSLQRVIKRLNRTNLAWHFRQAHRKDPDSVVARKRQGLGIGRKIKNVSKQIRVGIWFIGRIGGMTIG